MPTIMYTLRSVLFFSLLCSTLFAQNHWPQAVYFSADSYSLSDESKQILDHLAASSTNAEGVMVTGFTDSDGSEAYNITLSKNRANSVAAYLTGKGVPTAIIRVVGKGEMEPVADNISDAGKAMNRRVEIAIALAGMPAGPPEVKFQIPNSFRVPEQKKTIDPTTSQDVSFGVKGTVLHVPANAFVYADGRKVTEPVTLVFREFTNSAEMAFSGLPMTYMHDGEQMRFNSGGMFSVTGHANNTPVEISSASPLSIDYALAAKPDDMSFFALDEKNNWNRIQEIAPEKPVEVNIELFHAELVVVADGDSVSDLEEMGDGFRLRRFNGERIDQDADVFDEQSKQVGALIRGNDPGHTYPDIVAGLSIGSFGVYNCDQIYRVPDIIPVMAKFVDEKGKPIQNMHVVSLIDLNYNGAFSFDPKGTIMMSASGKNVLAVFTTSGELYLTERDQLETMDLETGRNYTFTMHDHTKTIKNTKALAEYLMLE